MGERLGIEVEFDNEWDFEMLVEELTQELVAITPELGPYPHYYVVIK